MDFGRGILSPRSDEEIVFPADDGGGAHCLIAPAWDPLLDLWLIRRQSILMDRYIV